MVKGAARRRHLPVRLLLAAAIVLALPGCRRDDPREPSILTIATTTSTENSGLLAHLHPDFEQRTGVRIKVIAKGTGASLQLGRSGNVDLVLVHAPEAEAKFVSEGYGVERHDVMHNDFVVLGPPGDPAGALRAGGDVAQALTAIASAGQLFVSRGDRSGTHMKEQELWQSTGLTLVDKKRTLIRNGKKTEVSLVEPRGHWYRSVGQGMGRTIHVATEKRAYTLSDRGTFYALALGKKARTNLAIVCEGDPRLANPYGVIAVNPKRHPHVNQAAAQQYIEWLTSPRVQAMIGGFRQGGKVLFHPAAGGR